MALQSYFNKFILLGSLLLIGCTPLYSWVESMAFKGWVMKVYSQEELQSISCLALQEPNMLANNTFAEIKRAKGRRYVYIVAIVPKSLKINIGDQVEIEPKLCKKGTIPQVTNILEHHS